MIAIALLEYTDEDLWWVTRGQLLDHMVCYEYRKYCERREHLTYAMDELMLKHGKVKSVEEVCGRWLDNRVMSWAEANKWVMDNVKQKARSKGNS